MSMRGGDRAKTGQKHRNTTAFMPLPHGCPKKLKEARTTSLAGLCGRCRARIEWKRQFNKYKPLTVPRRCCGCGEKSVTQAYYTLCHQCAEGRTVCAKCGDSVEELHDLAN